MEEPLDASKLRTEVGQRVIDKPDLPPQGIFTDNEAYAETVAGEMHLRRGLADKFEVFCDEGTRIGGTDRYPTPMAYMALGTGF